jgi:hypothetical protein
MWSGRSDHHTDSFHNDAYTYTANGAFRDALSQNCQLRHVCPSISTPVRMEQLGSRWMDFHEI